jgi:hypothetical protein
VGPDEGLVRGMEKNEKIIASFGIEHLSDFDYIRFETRCIYEHATIRFMAMT